VVGVSIWTVKIDNRNGRGGNPQRIPVELAFQFGKYEGDCARGACGRRNDAHRGCSGAAKIAVRLIKDLLIVCIGVDRSHEATIDLYLSWTTFAAGARQLVVQEHSKQRDEPWVILVFVHSHHNGEIFAFGRRRNNDLLRSAFGDVVFSSKNCFPLLVHAVFLDREEAGALDDNIDSVVAPSSLDRSVSLKTLIGLPSMISACCRLDRAVELAVVRIVLQQVSHRLEIADIIERHDFECLRIVIPDCL